MKTIVKLFTTIKQAGRFQDSLYNKYDHVRLLRSPFFESGMYYWEVSEGQAEEHVLISDAEKK